MVFPFYAGIFKFRSAWFLLYQKHVILAAAYGYGFAKNHCFVDSNKRVAFMTMYTFLNLNGYEINATEPQVVDLMLGVADGSITEEQLITWLRMHVLPDDDDKN
jgi:death-on-curing protein